MDGETSSGSSCDNNNDTNLIVENKMEYQQEPGEIIDEDLKINQNEEKNEESISPKSISSKSITPKSMTPKEDYEMSTDEDDDEDDEEDDEGDNEDDYDESEDESGSSDSDNNIPVDDIDDMLEEGLANYNSIKKRKFDEADLKTNPPHEERKKIVLKSMNM